MDVQKPPSTFALYRFMADSSIILRGGAAFSGEWEKNSADYCAFPEQKLLIENKMQGLILSAQVDNLLNYISDLLMLIFHKYPMMIDSGKINQKMLWESENLHDLRWSAIERAVQDLTFKGLDELDKYCKDKYCFSLTFSKFNKTRLSYIIESRNSITHNRGLFSSVSDKRLNGLGRLIDKPVVHGNIIHSLHYIINHVRNIDRHAAEKFDLKRTNERGHLDDLAANTDRIELTARNYDRRKRSKVSTR